MFLNRDYSPYFLSENPFPSDPSFNKYSPDKRINGDIFNEEIFKDELTQLYKLIGYKMNLIYCQNVAEFICGVGKSAIIDHAWRQLQNSGQDITSVFIRCQQKDTPGKLCLGVIRDWHAKGFLWQAMASCLVKYSETETKPEITRGGAQLLYEKKWPVDKVDPRVCSVYNADRLVKGLTKWAVSSNPGINYDIALTFFSAYLSSPSEFVANCQKTLKKIGKDEIDLYGNMLLILGSGGFTHHYLFLDQFEDAVYGLAGKQLIEFSSGMRRMLEAGVNISTIIVTLHPGAAMTLGGQNAQEFKTIADLDNRHRVDIDFLTEDDAVSLATTYLQAFRKGIPPNPVYPFTKYAITDISKACEGQIRGFLTGLKMSIERGLDDGYPEINTEYIQKFHEEITGVIHPSRITL